MAFTLRNCARIVNKIKGVNILSLAKMSSSQTKFDTLKVTVPKEFVYHVELDRPKVNAMNRTMWLELKKCFEELNFNPDCRVIVLSAAGRMFTAGIDLNDLVSLAPQLAEQTDLARKAKILVPMIKAYQQSVSSLELCSKPVIAAIHNACIGAGVNFITAADMRYCTKDAYIQVKEVGIGMAADVGALQRLPKVIGSESLVRELCFTARKMDSSEALSCGLVSKVFDDKESMIRHVVELAVAIAKQSPVAVQATKKSLVYSRDHSVQEGLDHIASLNQFLLQSEDLATAAVAQLTKQTDVPFSKL